MVKRQKIKNNHEFQKIIAKKLHVKSLQFVVYYTKNNLGYDRYGISVGTKIGNAVLRNKIKRQIRSMLPTKIIYKNDKTSYDFIIIVRKDYLNKSYEDNKKNLYYLLETKVSSKIRKEY